MTPEQLKASILQYAIQGKLVEQRPEEGTGEELYQQIQAERQRLIQMCIRDRQDINLSSIFAARRHTVSRLIFYFKIPLSKKHIPKIIVDIIF